MSTINGTTSSDTLAGTTGNDVIYGLDGSDILFGDAGNDTLYGGNGLDFLEGYTGNDLLDGGADFDFATYIVSPFGVTVSLAITGPQNTGGAGTDTLVNIEGLIGSDYNDTLSGDAGTNIIDARGGVDQVYGGDGTDILQISTAADFMAGEVYDGGPGYDGLLTPGGVNLSLATIRNIEEIDATGTLSALPSQINGLQHLGTTGALTLTSSGTVRLAGCEVVTTSFVLGASGIELDLSGSIGGGYSVTGSPGTDIITGGSGTDNLDGRAGVDTLNGGGGNDTLLGGDEHDTLTGGAGNDTLDGGSNIDTAVFAGNKSAYTISQGASGTFTISGTDGSDTLSNVEYAKFDDQTVRLLPGTGVTIDWSAAPPTYMAGIRDFEGNDLGAASSWKLIGTADVNGDGISEHILVNRQNGRWAELGTESDGKTYFDNHGWAGNTRIVGIYIDPLVTNGTVVAGSDVDSQRRFQNDLNIENIHGILGQGDYNRDGLQEIYFSLTDGTAYLHAYMHADGNIQYANYQNKQQVIDYLTNNGWSSSAWAGWFPASQTLAVPVG